MDIGDSLFLNGFDQRNQEHIAQAFIIWGKPLRQFIMNRVKSSMEADDITSESFLALMKANGQFPSFHEVRAFLFKVASNLCADLWRKRNKEHQVEIVEDALLIKDPTQMDIETSYADVADLHHRVLKAIAQLPKKVSEVLHLKYIKGLSNEKIAEQLHKSINTINNQVSAGKKTLQAQLGDLPFLTP